ncbi:MAG: DoxX family protein [Acidobacteriota bacterium]
MNKTVVSWVLQLVVAVILGQTLFFKFTAAPESVELFTILGLEPHGRILIGVAELVAVVLLVVPRTVPVGAALSAGLMVGALGAHVTKLGFEGDMGSLAALGAVALAASLGLLLMHRRRLPVVGGMF